MGWGHHPGAGPCAKYEPTRDLDRQCDGCDTVNAAHAAAKKKRDAIVTPMMADLFFAAADFLVTEAQRRIYPCPVCDLQLRHTKACTWGAKQAALKKIVDIVSDETAVWDSPEGLRRKAVDAEYDRIAKENKARYGGGG